VTEAVAYTAGSRTCAALRVMVVGPRYPCGSDSAGTNVSPACYA